MPEKPTTSCVQPSKGPIGVPADTTPDSEPIKKEKKRMTVMVGKPAPDFEATASVDGAFKNIKLSDFKGKWILLCFYPGDFTFV